MKRVATVVALCLAALSAQGQEACTNPKIVKTYSIEEVQQSEGYYAYGGLAANTAMEEDKSRAPSTAPGELTVKASVIVTFDLL